MDLGPRRPVGRRIRGRRVRERDLPPSGSGRDPAWPTTTAPASGSSGSSSQSGASGRSLSLEYSECMRAHGVTNFPDPQGDQLPKLGPNSGIDTNSSSVRGGRVGLPPVHPGSHRERHRAGQPSSWSRCASANACGRTATRPSPTRPSIRSPGCGDSPDQAMTGTPPPTSPPTPAARASCRSLPRESATMAGDGPLTIPSGTGQQAAPSSPNPSPGMPEPPSRRSGAVGAGCGGRRL